MDERTHRLEEVCECAFHVDLMLGKCQQQVTKADGDDELRDVVLPPLVISLARLLAARFRRRADGEVDEAAKALAGAGTTAAIIAAVKHLNDVLGTQMAEAAAGDMAKATRSMYEEAKLGAARELKLRPLLSAVDERVQEWMTHAYPWWVGEYHSRVLGKQILTIAEDVIINHGLSGTEAAGIIRNQLTRLYGVGHGEKSPVAVPRSYRGQPDQYWLGLANHAATTARMFGRLSAMQEAGVTVYTIISARDERVCGLCRFMDGKEFSVAEGVRQRDAILATTTPDEYRAVAGWVSEKQARAIFDEGGLAAMAKSGMCLSLFHFLCRCDLQPIIQR